MPDNKVTDNRCRRYIRITDEESWRIDYINSYRISVACDQMQTYNFDVAAAAQWVGYTDIKYFSRVFKEKKGMTPSEYIIKTKNEEDDPFEWLKAKGLFFR